MSVAEEIVALARIAEPAKVTPQEVQHFVAGKEGSGTVEFKVPTHRCAVVTEVTFFEVDQSQPSNVHIGGGGLSAVTPEQEVQVIASGPVFYVFKSGKVKFTFSFVPSGGSLAHVQVKGYFLPEKALEFLSRCATLRIVVV